MSIALMQIIISAISEKELCKNKLEVEESGRLVAALQGNVSGYKNLLGLIATEFHMPIAYMEDTGDKPLVIQDLEDAEFVTLQASALSLRETEEWMAVLEKINDDIEYLKNFLLYEAEKTRDLDLSQGKYKAETFFNTYFKSLEWEYDRRQNKKKNEKENPSLPFDEEENNVPDEQSPVPDFPQRDNVLEFQSAASN